MTSFGPNSESQCYPAASNADVIAYPLHIDLKSQLIRIELNSSVRRHRLFNEIECT